MRADLIPASAAKGMVANCRTLAARRSSPVPGDRQVKVVAPHPVDHAVEHRFSRGPAGNQDGQAGPVPRKPTQGTGEAKSLPDPGRLSHGQPGEPEIPDRRGIGNQHLVPRFIQHERLASRMAQGPLER